MNKQLKRYQEKAVNDLVSESQWLLSQDDGGRTIVFKSPTGSGKTFMMSQYIKQLLDETPNNDICFLWLSPGKGELHKQSYASLEREVLGYPEVSLLEQDFFGSRTAIHTTEVVVGNWEKLSLKDGKTGKWKSNLMKEKETTNFRELIANTKKLGIKVVLIIDESHSRKNAKRAFELREDIIKPYLTIEMSATPILKEGEFDKLIDVKAVDVINEGMIKKEILINEDVDKIDNSEDESQDVIMRAAFAKRNALKAEYAKLGIDINPLAIIQLPTGERGDAKKESIEKFLAERDITKDNGKLAVWLSDEKRNQEADILNQNNNAVEFLIFKQAIDTGWDCPRAQVLVRLREVKSITFAIQTVGRILRMPEARHYGNDLLDTAYVYSNVKEMSVQKEADGMNIIKSITVKRDEIYTPLRLRSYYKKRLDYGDVKANVYEVMSEVFCDRFVVTDTDSVDDVNKKVGNVINIKGLKGKHEIILNKSIDTKLFDTLDKDVLDNFELYSITIAETDKESAFENVILHNLQGFAPVRSLPVVKNALYKWFKKYMGVDVFDNGLVYIQNIVLNNSPEFEKLIGAVIAKYKPLKEKEVKQKEEAIEQWSDDWEIQEKRNYNEYLYKEFDAPLSLYKRPSDKKVFLNFDSEVEKDFVRFLEKNEDKISWWWQNGNEHMVHNFGIKYNGGSTFQPDFLVMLKDGSVGIFDTKASGFNEGDNKQKAEALQEYIKEENTKDKKLFGGIVIKQRDMFMVNGDDEYAEFKPSATVNDKGVAYGDVSEAKQGWRFLEF